MIDKGTDSTNPLAIIGASVLSAIGGYLASLFTRSDKHGTESDDDSGCATKSELRVLRADLGGDIAYVREQVDILKGTMSRIISGGHAGNRPGHGGDD